MSTTDPAIPRGELFGLDRGDRDVENVLTHHLDELGPGALPQRHPYAGVGAPEGRAQGWNVQARGRDGRAEGHVPECAPAKARQLVLRGGRLGQDPAGPGGEEFTGRRGDDGGPAALDQLDAQLAFEHPEAV
jgi:hypothetical protein